MTKICECGCGQPLPLFRYSSPKTRFINGHHNFAKTKTVSEAFWSCVPVAEIHDCWEWQGTIQDTGYGRFKVGTQPHSAHRTSWEIHFGPIPKEMHVLHRCDNRKCVNPAHLFLGTNDDNIKDMIAKQRHAHGETNGASKLNDAQVVEILELLRAGELNQNQIAARFGVTDMTIIRIKQGVSWRHVPRCAALRDEAIANLPAHCAERLGF